MLPENYVLKIKKHTKHVWSYIIFQFSVFKYSELNNNLLPSNNIYDNWKIKMYYK